MRRRAILLASALLLALLTAPAPSWCLEEAVHAPDEKQQAFNPDAQQQQPPRQDAHKFDITVEEAILQTYAGDKKEEAGQQQQQQERQPLANPDARRQQQQQQAVNPGRRQQQQQQAAPDTGAQVTHGQAPKLQAEDAVPGKAQESMRARQQRQAQAKQRIATEARRLREDAAVREAEHAKIMRRQQHKEAAAAGERLAAQQEEEKQQQSLGRGSLRTRKKPAAKQPVITGSNKNDMFAQMTERQLAATRARVAAARQAQQAQSGGATVDSGAGATAGAVGAGVQQQQAKPQAGAKAGGAAARVAAAKRAQSIPVGVILAMTLAMAAAAGLGALPFFFVRTLSEVATGVATAIACGVMLAASFDLVHDGQPYGAGLTVLGVLLGGWFIQWVQQHLAAYEDIQFGSLQGSSARKTVLMVGIMAAHALGEGCAVGVSFCGERGWAQGVLTTLAIGVHNIPEGLAKATVLVGQGVSAKRALWWSVATCLPQPLVAVPSFLFVDAFMMILPVALGFAAGCMIWMVFAELLPDALERAGGSQVATAATVSAAGLEGFRMFFASLEHADGTFGGGAAAVHAFGTLGRMGPPLLVLLPAVAVAAAGGGALGGSAIPAPVAWGVAAAVALSAGGGTLADQLLWRAQVPALHTLAAGAVGAILAVLLHRQLLQWAGTSAGKLQGLEKKHGMPGCNGGGPGGGGSSDLEAVEYASMYQQHHVHHHPPKHHHHTHPLPVAVDSGGAEGGATYTNGYAGIATSLNQHAPYHRSGASNGSAGAVADGSITPTGFGLGRHGSTTPVPRIGWRAMGRLPAPQLAAALTTGAALAAGALTTGWHLACTLLLLDTDRSAVLLPAAVLLLAGPGLGAGALARTAPSRSGSALGAWAAGMLAAVAALAAAVTAARAHESAHTATLVRHFLYPFGIIDSAEALAGGALCAAAWLCLSAGSAVKPRSARGGLAVGLALTALLAGLRYALCSFTPYCLSIHVLLQQAQ